jgi:hypothetical protein
MLSDDQIRDRIQELGLEEEYICELLASLGFDPAEGFTTDSIAAFEAATLEERRRAALRTLAMAPD